MKLLQAWAPPASRIASRARTIAGSSGEHPDSFEREVRLDRGADVDRAARVDRPAAVGELLILDVRAHLTQTGSVSRPEEGHEQDVFGFEDRVPFELADPVAVVVLPREEPVRRSLERPIQAHRGWHYRRADAPPQEKLPIQRASRIAAPSLLAIMRWILSSGRGVLTTALSHKTSGGRGKCLVSSTCGAHPT